MKRILFLAVFLSSIAAISQPFTRKDSLQGGLRPERTSFDVKKYDLNITIDPKEKSIRGYNEISFLITENTQRIQLDLFQNMTIDSIVSRGKKLDYKRDFGAVFINFPQMWQEGMTDVLRFYYHGKPIEAPHAPWQGGFVWKKDSNGKDFIGVAVQGTGSSLWFPSKDTQTDEPDNGARIAVTIPTGLTEVSNGRLESSADLGNGWTRWVWEVTNPINNYDITVNIADYAHIHDTHNGLDLDFYVLKQNEAKAREHFKEVHSMLDCFEDKFGPYPFKEDGYKLVETPYLGMEHQSVVAYGNDYLKGYKGSDLSGTGIGLSFDYIIVHESGHEWFGNSITSKDIADMWIHEGFTMYSEAVYVECTQGKEKAYAYMNGIRKNIHNYDPVIGQYGVNNEGSGDMYPKGAWMLHTLRNVLNDDERWWKIINRYSTRFAHQIIDTRTVCDYFSREMSRSLRPVFEQYLNTTKIPLLVWENENGKWSYRYENTVSHFSLPVDIVVNGKTVRIEPTPEKQFLNGKDKPKVLTENFLIDVKGL
ncbi:M1 family metallopeptidase [Flavobacterium silvaticum]|uniref:M1 family metallopeptidase n=1 Tax=Flavobacterium silvaticum TaxID=1852020 RepID=A0A972FT96_9FLAO|nr:M1 family metallopeptidase [Flavobacterium silvaticum]NMH28954.1 M1 family metallopeptidase [Flavobacterium silvaticum]